MTKKDTALCLLQLHIQELTINPPKRLTNAVKVQEIKEVWQSLKNLSHSRNPTVD